MKPPPLHQQDQTSAAPSSRDPTGPTPGSAPQGKVLVIDDELGPRESVKRALENQYDCLTASGGLEGLEVLDREPVDLIILDLKMPEMDGLEALRRVREKHSDIEVVLLTGYGTLESAQKAIRFGVFDFLNKPFEVEQLRDVVRRGVERKQSRNLRAAERDDLERLIGKMKTEISSIDRLAKVGQLSAGVVHEMKNPLTVILGYTQMLLEMLQRQSTDPAYHLTEQSTKYLSIIENETLRCSEIARKLLALSRDADAGVTQCAVREVVHDVAVLMQPQCSVNKVDLDVGLPPEELGLNVVPGDLRDTLLNLCFNSIQAMPQGGALRIHCTAVRPERSPLENPLEAEKQLMERSGAETYAAIEVTDTGRGIAPENVARIFDPFFTTKPGETGTGLGLALCKEKTERNGGSISLVATSSAGTTFRLLFPAEVAGPGG